MLTASLLRRNRDAFFDYEPSASAQLHGKGSPTRKSPSKSSPKRWFLQEGYDGRQEHNEVDYSGQSSPPRPSSLDKEDATGRPIDIDAGDKANTKRSPQRTSKKKASLDDSDGIQHEANVGVDGADGDEAVERIGELSRQEDEYDFAILLKPSKFEERLHFSQNDAESPTKSDRAGIPDICRESGINTLTVPLPSPSKGRIGKSSNKSKLKGGPTVGGRELIVQRIKRTGLEVKRLLSLDGKQTLLKVKAPLRVLERGAERMRMHKLRRFDRIWMEFSHELRATFEDFDGRDVRFIDSEKQSIVHWLLTAPVDDVDCSDSDDCSGGTGLNETCALRAKYVVQMYPLHKHDLGVLRAQWVTFWRRPTSLSGSSGQYDATSVGPTELEDSKPSQKTSKADKYACGRLVRHALDQPIDQVAQYFGEKVAFYFAWTEMYTRWLVVPSIAGAALFALQVRARKLDHPAAPLYALFMALWTSAFLLAWQRQAARLSYRWGTLGYEEAETTRPEYYGDPVKGKGGGNSGTGVKVDASLGAGMPAERHYPAWKRYVKYCATVPSVVLCIVAVVLLAFAAFSTRDKLAQQALATRLAASHVAKGVAAELAHGGLTLENLKQLADIGMDADFWFYLLITPALYGLLIPALDVGFMALARRLNDWENHETETQYQSHLILKVLSFRFVHVFASLYYYAFASTATPSSSSSDAFGSSDEGTARADSLLRVAIQLASFMVTGQLWKHVSETLLPFLQRKMRAQRRRRAANAQFSRSAVFNAPSSVSAFLSPNAVANDEHAVIDSSGMNMVAWRELPVPQQSNVLVHEQCVRLEQSSDRAWEEAALPTYDTFQDYAELLLQFGYVSFFSLAFPLAPLLALANNVFELRANAFKLCHAKQRPIARKASGIGIWFPVLQLMSVLAVLTNYLNIALATTLVERLNGKISAAGKVWLVFGVEHALLALKGWMQVVTPATPRDVQEKVRLEREHAKRESARALAARVHSAPSQHQQRKSVGS